MWSEFLQFLNLNLERVIYTGIIVLIIAILFIIMKFTLGRFEKSKLEKRKRASTVAKLIQSILRYVLFIIGVISILGVWGLDVGPILAGAGIVGIAVAFGAQSLIRDLLSGISIVFDNYYDVGDVVEIKEFKGTVLEVGLKSTKIVNWRGEVKVFSNGDISDVTNYSKNPSVALVEIKVSFDENIENVITLLDENLGQIRDIYHQVLEGPNVVGVTELGESTYTIRITAKTISEQHYQVERAINRLVKELFDKNNISRPYQHMVILDDKSNKNL